MDIKAYKEDIDDLCRKHKVKSLYAFGSVVTGKFNPESDVDFIVDIKSTGPLEYAENYFDLKFELESLLQRPIDLLEQKGLKNRYLIQNINKHKVKIYEA